VQMSITMTVISVIVISLTQSVGTKSRPDHGCPGTKDDEGANIGIIVHVDAIRLKTF